MNGEKTLAKGKLLIAAIGIAALYLLLVVIVDAIIEVEEHVDTPSIRIIYEPYGDNDTAVRITSVDPAPVPINDTSLYVRFTIESTTYLLTGALLDINGLDFGNATENITFEDRDGDGNVSVNDTFLVRSEENGGWFDPHNPSWIYLIYDPSGEAMNPKLNR